jgi:hypothetical protein
VDEATDRSRRHGRLERGVGPPSIDDESAPVGEFLSPPTGGGVAVRIAVFPPEHEIDASRVEAYETAMNELYGEQEIWAVFEEGETLLRRGDCLVQRGTRHAWKNRSDRPCTLVSTMLAGVRR